ncbi:MAG: PhoU domain-containing protein [Xanthomonadales bacterium]
MSHLEQRMEADLNAIRDWVWKIGDDVENALREAKKTLVLRDPELAYRIILGDHPINRASRRCDRLCHRFIARYLPGAGALREMASTIRINVILERIGDYAVTICREALQLDKPLPEKFEQRIDDATDTAIEILHDARKAFRDGNAERAIALMQAAKRLDARMDAIYDDLFEKDPALNRNNRMVIFGILAVLKRVADQSKNICDQTVFAVRGIDKLPKVYRILFLDRAGSHLAQLATAIGRHNFPHTVEFTAATPGRGQAPAADLVTFLSTAGLPDEDLKTEPLEALEHDLSNFEIIIALNGPYSDYIERVPFHTSALNWPVPTGDDFTGQYRDLGERISGLVDLLAGSESGD